jgi:hypothetical protein
MAYLIDEFRTSKLCCGCREETEVVKVKSGKINKKGNEIDSRNSILGCHKCFSVEQKLVGGLKNTIIPRNNVKTQVKYMNRDTNSTMNMLNIVHNVINSNDHERPKEFVIEKEENNVQDRGRKGNLATIAEKGLKRAN